MVGRYCDWEARTHVELVNGVIHVARRHIDHLRKRHYSIARRDDDLEGFHRPFNWKDDSVTNTDSEQVTVRRLSRIRRVPNRYGNPLSH